MKVVHLNTERTWRGGERQLMLLAQALQNRGHQNWIACRKNEPLAIQCQKKGLPLIFVNSWGAWDLASAWKLRKFLLQNKIDILHAHTAHGVGLGALGTLKTPVKFVATRRVDFPLRGNVFSRWKYKRLDAVATVSGCIREVMLRGWPSKWEISVIHSGIDPTDYPSAHKRDQIRQKNGFSLDEKLVIQVAALEPHKGQEILLEAAQRVCHDVSNVRFIVLGKGRLEEFLLAKAKDLGLSQSVLFLGHRPDVLDFIAMSDVFVLSSVEEGLGTSLLDALAIGVPTVATRAGGIPEIYGSPDAEELIGPKDPESLALAIKTVLQDSDLAQQRVLRGFDIVKKFSVHRMTDQYERMYKNVMNDKGAQETKLCHV